MYLQKCDSFTTANGTLWQIKCEVNCHSKNVVYYQVCAFCKKESNIGKTDDLRDRTNNHITSCKNGTGSNKFDLHVYTCSKNKGMLHSEPCFKLYVFMVLNDYNKLRNHERRLHLQGHDTINSTRNS